MEGRVGDPGLEQIITKNRQGSFLSNPLPTKEEHKMKTSRFKILLLTLLAFSLSIGFSEELLAKPVKLKAVVFLSKDHPLSVATVEWVKRVNTELKDQIEIDYAGGAEIIPPYQQNEALKNGVIDINFNATANFVSMFPEGWAFFVSKYSPTEERKKGGFYDLMVNRFQKINMMYLGRWLYLPFYLWVNRPVTQLTELRGLKMRTGGAYDRFMKELGIVPVTVPPGDVYTALERGTVDGFGWPIIGARDLGWTDKCKNYIDHPFNAPSNCIILMNLNVWNGLSKTVQAKIMEITEKFEPYVVDHFKKAEADERMALEKIGVKRIQFSPEETKKYLDTSIKVSWDMMGEKVPDLVPELKRATGN